VKKVSLIDIITQFIIDELERQGVGEIGRNQLAYKFNCSPSQINYVITTRFNPNQGYIVTSRRGGGGYIRIAQLKLDKRGKIIHIINSIGEQIDLNTVNIIVKDLLNDGFLNQKEANLISAAISESAIKWCP
jgi:transcriptional regulator CtsR